MKRHYFFAALMIFLLISLVNSSCNPKGSPADSVNILITKTGLKTMIIGLEGYREEFGDYPEKLEDILIKKNIAEENVFNDAWGHEYHYERLGSGYVIFSMGRDGKPFTDDDIYPAQ